MMIRIFFFPFSVLIPGARGFERPLGALPAGVESLFNCGLCERRRGPRRLNEKPFACWMPPNEDEEKNRSYTL